MVRLLLNISLMFHAASSGASIIAVKANNSECQDVRSKLSQSLINRLESFSESKKIQDEATKALTSAIFHFNSSLNSHLKMDSRRSLSDCVNHGVYTDVSRYLSGLSTVNLQKLRFAARSLALESSFADGTATGDQALRHARNRFLLRFIYGTLRFGAGGIVFGSMLAMTAHGPSVESFGAFAVGLGLGFILALLNDKNEEQSAIHSDAVGFSLRSCAELLGGKQRYTIPEVGEPLPIGFIWR